MANVAVRTGQDAEGAKRRRTSAATSFGMFPKAVTDKLEKLANDMEAKMQKRRSVREELNNLSDKVRDLERYNKWPAGYSRPGVGGDPVILEAPIGQILIAKYRSTEEASPLFNVTSATTMAQLKFMVNLAAVRQIIHLDIEMLTVKINTLGRDRLLDRTLGEMKQCVAQHFKSYEDEGFEVPSEWSDMSQHDSRLKEFLQHRYNDPCRLQETGVCTSATVCVAEAWV